MAGAKTSWWKILGIAPTSDVTTIRKAYAGLVKAAQADSDSFQRLRQAYEQAMRHAEQGGSGQEDSSITAPAPPKPQRETADPLTAWTNRLQAGLQANDDTKLAALLADAAFIDVSATDTMRIEAYTLQVLSAVPHLSPGAIHMLKSRFGWGDISNPIRMKARGAYDTFLKRIDAAQLHEDLVELANASGGYGYGKKASTRLRNRAAALICGTGKPTRPLLFFSSPNLERICAGYVALIDNTAPWSEPYYDVVRLQWMRRSFLKPPLLPEVARLAAVLTVSMGLLIPPIVHLGNTDGHQRGGIDAYEWLFVCGVLWTAYIVSYQSKRFGMALARHMSHTDKGKLWRLRLRKSLVSVRKVTRYAPVIAMSFIFLFIIDPEALSDIAEFLSAGHRWAYSLILKLLLLVAGLSIFITFRQLIRKIMARTKKP